MPHIAAQLDRHIIPPPRPFEEIVAEFEAMYDPSSGRDAVLITPGSEVPALDEAQKLERVNVQPYGFIYTNNTHTAERLRQAADQNAFANKEIADCLIGEALFQAAGYNGMPEGADVYVSAYNEFDIQVSEVLANSSDTYALSVAEAVMRSHAGSTGYVKITPIDIDEVRERSKEWYERGGGVPHTLKDLM
jgi:hypothetical protein